MVEQFINDFVSQLFGHISDDDLTIVTNKIQLMLNDYDLVRKETAVAKYTGFRPECYKVYMVTKKIEGKSEKTLALYKLYLEDMFDTMALPLEEITSNNIKVYLYNVQQTRGISNRSLDSRRSVMNSFFTWAAAEQYIGKNPMATIKPIKYESKEREPLNDVELELVREACSDIREKAMVEFFYSTGCRVTEMERMNISDVDFSNLEVSLFGKGNKHRKSYLTAKSAILLKEYLNSRTDDNEALFVTVRSPHSRLLKPGIEKVIGAIGDRAGVDRLHPHLLRHTTASNALRHGMDVTQVQQLLGHSSLDTTMIYAKVDTSDVQRSHSKFIA